jgi:hypothetical protein
MFLETEGIGGTEHAERVGSGVTVGFEDAHAFRYATNR